MPGLVCLLSVMVGGVLDTPRDRSWFATHVRMLDGRDTRRVADEGWPAWLPDGQHLAIVTADSVYLSRWNGEERRLVARDPGLVYIRAPLVSPTGRFLAATVYHRRGDGSAHLRVWDLRSGGATFDRLLFERPRSPGCGGPSSPEVAWHPAEDRLAWVRTWDNDERHDERWLGFRRVGLWSPAGGYHSIDCGEKLSGIAWTRDGRHLLVGSRRGTLEWDPMSGRRLRRCPVAKEHPISSVPSSSQIVWFDDDGFYRLSGEAVEPVIDRKASRWYALAWADGQGSAILSETDADQLEVTFYRGRLGQPFGEFERLTTVASLGPWVALSPHGRLVAWTIDEGVWMGWPESGI